MVRKEICPFCNKQTEIISDNDFQTYCRNCQSLLPVNLIYGEKP